MIRVMLVDDSPIALHILQRLLLRSPDIQVVGTATDGAAALELLPALDPEVICTDMHMAGMDGLAFTRAVMSSRPRPILVVSVSVEPGSANVFSLLEAGAVDVYPKPRAILEADQEKLAHELASKIRIVAGVHVFRRGGETPRATTSPWDPSPVPTPHAPVRMVAMGASTGGPQALRTILASLPATFPAPVACVQHIGADFLDEMVRWLAEVCPLPVRKAEQGKSPLAGTVYFAPENAHLEFDEHGRFALTRLPPLDGHRPSVTATMHAAARCFGAGAVGVLLTGMGRDGADGMAAITAAGGVTIAQDEASSVVYGMPKEAVARGAAQFVLPLDRIARVLIELVKSSMTASVPSRGKETSRQQHPVPPNHAASLKY